MTKRTRKSRIKKKKEPQDNNMKSQFRKAVFAADYAYVGTNTAMFINGTLTIWSSVCSLKASFPSLILTISTSPAAHLSQRENLDTLSYNLLCKPMNQAEVSMRIEISQIRIRLLKTSNYGAEVSQAVNVLYNLLLNLKRSNLRQSSGLAIYKTCAAILNTVFNDTN